MERYLRPADQTFHKQLCVLLEKNEKLWDRDERYVHDLEVMKVFEEYFVTCSPTEDDIDTLIFIRFMHFTIHVRIVVFLRSRMPSLYQRYLTTIMNDHVSTLLFFHFVHPNLSALLVDTELNYETVFGVYVKSLTESKKQGSRMHDVFGNANEAQIRILDDLLMRSIPAIYQNIDNPSIQLSYLAERFPYLRRPVAAVLIEKSAVDILQYVLNENWVWELEDDQLGIIIQILIDARVVGFLFKQLPRIFTRWPDISLDLISQIYFSQPKLIVGEFASIENVLTAALEIAIVAPSVNWDIVIAQLTESSFMMEGKKLIVLLTRIMNSNVKGGKKLDVLLFLIRQLKGSPVWRAITLNVLINEDVISSCAREVVYALLANSATTTVLKLLEKHKDNESLVWFLKSVIREYQLPIIEYKIDCHDPPHHRHITKLVKHGKQNIFTSVYNSCQICIGPADSSFALILHSFKREEFPNYTIRVHGNSFFVLVRNKFFHFEFESLVMITEMEIDIQYSRMTLIDGIVYIISYEEIFTYDPISHTHTKNKNNVVQPIGMSVWPDGYGYITRSGIEIYQKGMTSRVKYPMELEHQLHYRLKADANAMYFIKKKSIVCYDLKGQAKWETPINGYIRKIKFGVNDTLEVQGQRENYIILRTTGKVISTRVA